MNTANEHHKRALCFDGWYIWLLLTYGIGFKESDLQRLIFAHKFPSGKIGWTLGYMINQTNYIPAEYRKKSISKSHYIVWTIITISIVIVSFIFLILTCQKYIRRAYYKRTHHIQTISKDGYTQPHEQSTA